MPVELRIENGTDGVIKMVGNSGMVVSKGASLERNFFIYLKKADLKIRKTPLVIGIYSQGKKVETVKTNFLGPFVKN